MEKEKKENRRTSARNLDGAHHADGLCAMLLVQELQLPIPHAVLAAASRIQHTWSNSTRRQIRQRQINPTNQPDKSTRQINPTELHQFDRASSSRQIQIKSTARQRREANGGRVQTCRYPPHNTRTGPVLPAGTPHRNRTPRKPRAEIFRPLPQNPTSGSEAGPGHASGRLVAPTEYRCGPRQEEVRIWAAVVRIRAR
eukprot:1223740-Rhodomonas_salina.1